MRDGLLERLTRVIRDADNGDVYATIRFRAENLLENFPTKLTSSQRDELERMATAPKASDVAYLEQFGFHFEEMDAEQHLNDALKEAIAEEPTFFTAAQTEWLCEAAVKRGDGSLASVIRDLVESARKQS